MVWKSFSSSSSLSVPSEKKAWNSSRDSFPSSANSNTAAIREQQSEVGKAENQVIYRLIASHQNFLQVLLQNWPSTKAELPGLTQGGTLQLWLTQEQMKMLLGMDALAIGY